MSTDLLVATSNPHKIEEIAEILNAKGIRVIGLSDLEGGADLPEPDEDGDTFEANARKKSIGYALMTKRMCLADDSGLEVDALDGEPGVFSARYSDEGRGLPRAERDKANNRKLLAELENLPDEQRTARFVCAMSLATAEGEEIATSRGEFGGRIGHAERGDNGFGYDPLLVLDDGRTSAELTPAEKNARSHRGEATRKIADAIAKALANAT